MGYSVDLASTGLKQVAFGKPLNTLGAQAISTITGLSENQAELVYGLIGFGTQVGAIRTELQTTIRAGQVTYPRLVSTPYPRPSAQQIASHPLLKDSMPRQGDRLLLNQGPYPTCGHTSCAMVLDTTGNSADLPSMLARYNRATSGPEVVAMLKSNGQSNATFAVGKSVSDLGALATNGKPAIAMIRFGPTSNHWVVVDGITTRMGIQVVAIRDPWGYQYFSPLSTFKNSFNGQVVYLK